VTSAAARQGKREATENAADQALWGEVASAYLNPLRRVIRIAKRFAFRNAPK
jgi:hypothetical protein